MKHTDCGFRFVHCNFKQILHFLLNQNVIQFTSNIKKDEQNGEREKKFSCVRKLVALI